MRPIIVFDSGVGGLVIYRALKKSLPNQLIIYLTDSANFPYGSKSASWLRNRFIVLAKEFAILNPLLVVIACNSATTNVISLLRQSLKCSVVGVEPVIKPLSRYHSALALMTNASSQSPTTAKLLTQYGSHVRVYVPEGLASAIEYNDYEQVKNILHKIKKIVQKYQVQAIGLSCTHYSLILPLWEKLFPQVQLIDPTTAVVRQVHRVLRSI